MLGKHKCKDPFHSTHYRKLPQHKSVKTEKHVCCLSKYGAGSVLLHKLQQAEQLLNRQSNLIDELKEELAQAQGSHPKVQEDLTSMPESQLAAVQRQHTADMLQAVAEYVRQEGNSGACYAANSEDSLAAMQGHHTVKLIKEVTHYLQRDMQQMQRMCDNSSAKPVPFR